LIIATSYLVVFSRPLTQNPASTGLFVAAYFASNIVLAWIVPRFRTQYAFDISVVLFDTTMVSAGLALTGAASAEFYVVYFLVIFVSALTERLGLVVGAAVLISTAHLYTEARFIGFADLLTARYILRVPFLFVVAMFFGHLVEDARRREHEADEATARQRRMEFLSGVSHDLKNPLGVIQSLATLLLESDAGPLSGEQTDLVRRIHATARHGITFALNLIDAARIEAGRLVLQLSPVNFKDVVEDALLLARSAGELKGLQLQCVIEPDLPITRVDPIQMERVLSNVVGNAIKFTPASGTVTVSVSRRNDHVVLSVGDDGPGIPASDLPTIFEKYRRQAQGGTTEGSGLGLFIVKAIVEAHGGTVEIKSAAGEGTTVTIALPIAAAKLKHPSDAAGVSSSHPRWSPFGKHMRARRAGVPVQAAQR
jgi:signal transduction histidine kinase